MHKNQDHDVVSAVMRATKAFSSMSPREIVLFMWLMADILLHLNPPPDDRARIVECQDLLAEVVEMDGEDVEFYHNKVGMYDEAHPEDEAGCTVMSFGQIPPHVDADEVIQEMEAEHGEEENGEDANPNPFMS